MSVEFTQYSEFELKQQAFKFKGENTYTSMKCVGSSTENLDAREITKSCRGVVVKRKIKGAGTGTLDQTLHIPVAIWDKFYNMAQAGLIEGVKAYGQKSVHAEFSLVQEVEDEDGNVKYKAYPRGILTAGPNRAITNGATEVAEVSISIALMPDEEGNCMYEAFADELDNTTKAAWMTSWTPEMMQAQA